MSLRTIDAFVPGVFYLRPSPEAAPFKAPGDTVAVGDTVGLVEVMKSFLPIEATVAGRLVRFLVESEEMVDVDQPICEIEVAD